MNHASQTMAVRPPPAQESTHSPAPALLPAGWGRGAAVAAHPPVAPAVPVSAAGEASPVYAFQKEPTLVDYPGHLAAVFFVSECNLRCGFCHNAQLLGRRQEGLTWSRLDRACRHFRDNWVDGAAITGGEPTLTPQLPELIRYFKRQGFAVKLDTNGTLPDVLGRVVGMVDYVAMDIKCSLDRYPQLTGCTRPEAIRESIAIVRAQPHYEFRTTVIAPWHSDDEMQRIGALIRGAQRFTLQPFVPREDLPDPELRRSLRTPQHRLVEIKHLLSGCAQEIVCRH